MNNGILFLCFLTAVPMVAGSMSTPPAEPRVSMNGRLNCPYVSSNGGTAYLQISLTTSDVVRRDDMRRPMNIAVVLDRSGSMADQRKMENAKNALSRLIDRLENNDIFSLVVYDDVIDVLRSAQRVGGDRNELKQLVRNIFPRNSTNLGGGMMEGLRQVERNIGKEYVNRVILLSDGLANQGVTDPQGLNSIARRYRSKSISLTTMGVGLEYNENLMMGLAESGGGNYYFIESASQLASIMNKEFNTMSSVLAQNGVIELKLGEGVRVVDVIGCENALDRGTYRIQVGDICSNDCREFTVELAIPEGNGSKLVASGVLLYEGSRITSHPSFTVSARYTRDAAMIEKNRDMEVQAKADIAVSTRNVDHAMKALDEGRPEEAARVLQSAQRALSASPAAGAGGSAGAAVLEQASRIQNFDSALTDKSKDARRAKKAIQYENYQVQKRK